MCMTVLTTNKCYVKMKLCMYISDEYLGTLEMEFVTQLGRRNYIFLLFDKTYSKNKFVYIMFNRK
jgi:hypothetical protein